MTSVKVRHRLRLLSDIGPAYVSRQLCEYLAKRRMAHTRGRPYHPQTQEKFESNHRSIKNVVKLEHYHFPWRLEAAYDKTMNRLLEIDPDCPKYPDDVDQSLQE